MPERPHRGTERLSHSLDKRIYVADMTRVSCISNGVELPYAGACVEFEGSIEIARAQVEYQCVCSSSGPPSMRISLYHCIWEDP